MDRVTVRQSQTESDIVRQSESDRVGQGQTESDRVRQSQTESDNLNQAGSDRVRQSQTIRIRQGRTGSDRVRQSKTGSEAEAENILSLPGKSPETNDSRWRGKQSWRIFALSLTIRGASYVLRRDDWPVPQCFLCDPFCLLAV